MTRADSHSQGPVRERWTDTREGPVLPDFVLVSANRCGTSLDILEQLVATLTADMAAAEPPIDFFHRQVEVLQNIPGAAGNLALKLYIPSGHTLPETYQQRFITYQSHHTHL